MLADIVVPPKPHPRSPFAHVQPNGEPETGAKKKRTSASGSDFDDESTQVCVTPEPRVSSPLPQGWTAVYDEQHNRYYYVGPDGVSQWHMPTE